MKSRPPWPSTGAKASGARLTAERARRDAAAGGGGRWGCFEVDAEGGDVGGAVGDGSPVAAEGGWRAVEDGGVSGILSRQGPVPVRQRAFVAAFFLDGFSVEQDEVRMKGEE